jgi:hypothetical protein
LRTGFIESSWAALGEAGSPPSFLKRSFEGIKMHFDENDKILVTRALELRETKGIKVRTSMRKAKE